MSKYWHIKLLSIHIQKNLVANLKKLAVLILFFVNTESTFGNSEDEIQPLIREAELIFEGEVIDVTYRFSKTSESQEPTPYTFVTYQVANTIKGQYEPETLTLRFYGGPAGDGEFYSFSGQPYFDKGDRDVLLVKGNGRQLCPLVSCAQGRFRLINGLVVNENGRTIRLQDDGKISLGAEVDLEPINTHRMGDDIFLTTQEINDEGEKINNKLPPNQVNRDFLPDEAGFVSLIHDTVNLIHSPDELNALKQVDNADPEQAFVDHYLAKIKEKGASGPVYDEINELMDEEERIERYIEDRFNIEGLSSDERSAIIFELAKKFPQFYYDGEIGTSILARQINKASATSTQELNSTSNQAHTKKRLGYQYSFFIYPVLVLIITIISVLFIRIRKPRRHP